MKEKSRSRLLFALLFSTIIICLALVAIIIAMSLSLTQWKQESKALKDSVWVKEQKIDSLTPKYSEKQKAIISNVVGNPDIGKLVKTKPVLGGNWGVWSEKSVKFLSEDRLLIIYDDGHMMGAMIVRAVKPEDLKTWKVLWSTTL